MEFAAFLSAFDADRAHRTFNLLLRHSCAHLVLAGSFAIELHRQLRGLDTKTRPLHDIDFLANSFDDIPKTLSSDFICRHVHPNGLPGQTLLQSVHLETAVRVDIFRAHGNTIARAINSAISGQAFRTISIEDLTARTARLCMDLAQGTPMPAKHAQDFLRLLPLVKQASLEPVWQEHRKPGHPASFEEAVPLLLELIATRKELQIVPVYSHNTSEICPRCRDTDAFPLADAARVFSLLGYC